MRAGRWQYSAWAEKSFFAPLSASALKKKFFRSAECRWPEKKVFLLR